MDSQTFGSVMCGLGLFRERARAPGAKAAPHRDDDGDDGDAALDRLNGIDGEHDGERAQPSAAKADDDEDDSGDTLA
jgi:hypothetical protein